MKRPARNHDGSWCIMALDLASFFKCLPEDLFNDFQQEQKIDENRAYAEMEFAHIQHMLAARQTPEISMQRTELYEVIQGALGNLTAREEQVLRLRFGFDGPDRTLEEVAELLHLSTRERARQVEAKALRKLKKPRLARRLLEAGAAESGLIEDDI